MGGFVQPGSGGGGGGGGYGGGGGGGGGGGSTTVTVPNNMVGLVIGKGGENIRVMQVRSGASIQVQKEADARPGATEREIYLSGDPAAVANARQRM